MLHPVLDGLAIVADGDGCAFWVQVSPGAGRSAVVGLHAEALRVRVAAPPVDGRANVALLGFLADALGVPSRRVTLASGAGSRRKRVRVDGLGADAVRERLAAAVGGTGGRR